MRKLLISIGLVLGLLGGLGGGLTPTASAQTKITFARGAFSKTISTLMTPGRRKSYSVSVRSGQVINVELSGDIETSKTNPRPLVFVHLTSEYDGDQFEDGEGYLSVLTGRDGKYVFTLTNGSKRSRNVTFKVAITDDVNDYIG
jgi:hypothetical protein